MITNAMLERTAHALICASNPQLSGASVSIPRTRAGKLTCTHLYEVRGKPESVSIILGIIPFTPSWDATFPTLVLSASSIRRGELIAVEARGRRVT